MQRRFLRKHGAAGEDEDTCGEYPFSLATLASSPRGAPFSVAAKFAATAKAVPLGNVAATSGSRLGEIYFLSKNNIMVCHFCPCVVQ